MSNLESLHLSRVRAATTSKLGLGDLAKWIEENTYINGARFSFKNHEYQHQILRDTSPELVVRKSAQTGISEMAMRRALALLMVVRGSFRIGYTFPSAGFAQGYSKTRLNPIIRDSPALRAAVRSDDLDSSDIRTFGPGKELYFKGAAVGNAAISTTLDYLVHDELDFSDPEVIGDYWSRVLHSIYKWKFSLSTPTYVGGPIDVAFTNSRRHWNFCRCHHCYHMFVPDYYQHVYVPGWGMGKDLDTITKSNIHTIRYKEAVMLCPRCDRPVDLSPVNREWVCENPTESHVAAGYQVQPFDAPVIVTLPDLIVASTKYATKTKFKQFSLGLPATDSESGITQEDLDLIGYEGDEHKFTTHSLGIDLGIMSHFMVGGTAQDGTLVVVHMERVALKDFRRRYVELCTFYRIAMKVSDIQPYTDLIMALSETDPRLFGARYVVRQGLEVYDMKKEDADKENAIEGVRELSVNRNALFDKLLSLMRSDDSGAPVRIRIRKMTGEWELVCMHFKAMRRAQAALRNGEFSTVWTKPVDGHDHYWHALGYLWLAAQLRGVQAFATASLLGTPVKTFRLTAQEPSLGKEESESRAQELRRTEAYTAARMAGMRRR